MTFLITDPREIEAIRAITDRGHIVIDGERRRGPSLHFRSTLCRSPASTSRS